MLDPMHRPAESPVKGVGGRGFKVCKTHDVQATIVQCAMTLQPSALTQDDGKTRLLA
jgi:hypothetical protein